MDTSSESPARRPISIERLQYRNIADAAKILSPRLPPLPYDILERDRTLIEERYKAKEWTMRFFAAAFTWINACDPGCPSDVLEHQEQTLLQEQLITAMPGHYDKSTIEARISLLFPIAYSLYVGGQVMYQADVARAQSGPLKDGILFRERLEHIEGFLKKHKWLVMNLIEGKGTYMFVGHPHMWVNRRREMMLQRCQMRRRRREESAQNMPDVYDNICAETWGLGGDHGPSNVWPLGDVVPAQDLTEASSLGFGDLGSASRYDIRTPDATGPEDEVQAAATPTSAPFAQGPGPQSQTELDTAQQTGDSLDQLLDQEQSSEDEQPRTLVSHGRRSSARYRPVRLRSDSRDSYYDSSD